MSGEVENVCVFVRVRPLNKREKDCGCEKVTQINSECNQISLLKPETDVVKTFTFDKIFREDCTQTEVYCQTTRDVVEKVLQGYNGTVLAYGQTGTGKTYTMTGIRDADQGGIIPNTFAHIFNHIAHEKKELTFAVYVTFLEIYNENVRDLLLGPDKKSSNLEVREHAESGVFVENLSGYLVYTPDELVKMLNIGDRNRTIGATDLNIASSRSHTIFTITIESSDSRVEGGKHITRGKLQLVDLAGSERQSRAHTSGIRFKEATKINQSLSVLGMVIAALVEGKSNHIPYRNSKLTRLLQDSLGGNSKTSMITTVSCSDLDYDETISTLRYAGRAKFIKNQLFVNERSRETVLIRFQDEIEELRKQLGLIDITSDVREQSETPSKMQNQIKKTSKKELEAKESEAECHEVEKEIDKTKIEQEAIQNKIQNLSKKLLMGGENIIEKANHQEFLLKMTESQLTDAITRQEELHTTIKQYLAERTDIMERYPTLQEEIAGKTKKLRDLACLINNSKAELRDLQREHQREIEGLVDTVRGLTRELQLTELIVNTYIPGQYQNLIEKYIRWNEDLGEIHLKCAAYTGNNVKKRLDAQLVLVEVSPVKNNPYKQYPNHDKRSKRPSTTLLP